MQLEADASGSVWKINVKVGDRVEAGDPVVVLESMKMEIPIEAPQSGVITAVLVAESDMIEEGQPLLNLEP